MRGTDLTAAQKRALFKKRFGKKLQEKGFIWCRDRYVRIHEGEIQLSVSLYTAHRGFAFLCFDASPFCLGETDWANRWGTRVEQFIPCGSARDAFWASGFEEQFEQTYHLFFSALFEPFNALRGVRSLLHYQQNHLFPATGSMDHALTAHICLQLEEWQAAGDHILAIIAGYDAALEHLQETMETELRLAGTHIQQDQVRANCAARTQFILKEQSRLQESIRRLSCGDFQPLRELIMRNIAESQAASRESFPRAWPQAKV